MSETLGDRRCAPTPALVTVYERWGRSGAALLITGNVMVFFLDYAARIRSVTSLPLLLTGGMRTATVMGDAITSGAVDMVGLARPMTVEPDLPARLLAGSTAGAADIQVHVRPRLLDDFLQVAWFQQQIHRMGRGLDPDPARGVLPVIGRAFADGLAARWRR